MGFTAASAPDSVYTHSEREESLSSTFSWVDFAEDDRRKMSEVIALFREQDTRDELGLGGIRDTFADLLFPATSTIQTRARYFLFIPWVYQELERRRTLPADIERLARRDEVAARPGGPPTDFLLAPPHPVSPTGTGLCTDFA